MFAGEGDPARTNRRFKILSDGSDATRLSTAFDSVTLYGRDPDPRPDIYGKVGTSGVSVATLDDMKALYDGFDLRRPDDVGVDDDQRPGADGARVLPQHRDRPAGRRRSREREGREPTRRGARRAARRTPCANVRGTVQADILKEDQGQNTCLFSTEFSLRMMADIQEWFIEQQVRNFYSVSISGYHIAEAGANPISQLAFTLANGFTYVEAYLARGMDIDDFAPNLSFFFSNGMDPEYSVHRPRRPPHLGGRDEGEVRRQRALAEAEVPRADVRPVAARAGDGLQRHPHHAAGADRDLRQRQQPAHQRLRRGGHDPDRGVRTPRARDPADHQPRVGPGDEREPAPGLVRHRRAHRPGRGGRARRVRPRSTSAAACSARWRPATSAAGSRTSRCSTSTASTTARCRSSASTPSSSRVGRRRAARTTSSSPARPRPRRSRSSPGCAPSRPRTRAEAQEALARLKEAAISGDNVFAVLMDAARVCSLQQVTEAFFEVGGQYRRNV